MFIKSLQHNINNAQDTVNNYFKETLNVTQPQEEIQSTETNSQIIQL